MSVSSYMSPYVGLGLLVAYFLLSIEIYLATYALGTFRISYFKLGPTELRIILALGNLVLLFHPTATILGHRYPLFDVGGVVAAIGLFMTVVIAAIGHTRELYRAEPIPGKHEGRERQ